MSDALLPERRLPKLIVVAVSIAARTESCLPYMDLPSSSMKSGAVRTAKSLAANHAGVIAWSREANPALGEYGPPTVLFQTGEVPDME